MFVVGYLGDWRRAAAVLFDGESLSGNPAPRREAGEGVAVGTALSVALRGREGGGTAEIGDDLQNCLRASSGGGDKPHVLAVCIKGAAIGRKPEAGPQYGETLEEIAYTQNCVDVHGVMTPSMQVRRLTPEECEALQGFPRSYTAIPWRKKPADQCPDGPRYKALGNSWAVPCVRWIGRRIQRQIDRKVA